MNDQPHHSDHPEPENLTPEALAQFLADIEKETNLSPEELSAKAALDDTKHQILKRVVRNTRTFEENEHVTKEVLFAIGYSIDDDAQCKVYLGVYEQLFKGAYIYLLGLANPPIELREDVQKVINGSVQVLIDDLRKIANGDSKFCPFLAEQSEAWDADPIVWPAAVMFTISLLQEREGGLAPSLETSTQLLIRHDEQFVVYDRNLHPTPPVKPKIIVREDDVVTPAQD